eukprot:CAMPEP_0184312714 /NCGR_PEP_ID=MMETSP1049-20130417/52491_1 /TAXON_ID=77928 /ORGANISM="Proteomonas sulcata, Strain CCMP704" /LENGTH=121 /DNA_ID=CAMNT_0026629119 /DNA_START=1 /DNA_END=370 /DNA_ORIENTATION=+
MDPDSDPQHLSAFRQISVNLMISSEGTKRMGVSMHVAEIQLLLLPFAKIKTLDGHKRYIILRDGGESDDAPHSTMSQHLTLSRICEEMLNLLQSNRKSDKGGDGHEPVTNHVHRWCRLCIG